MRSDSLAPIRNESAAQDRARDLEVNGLNGLAAVLVAVDPPVTPGEAELELHFHNALHMDAVKSELDAAASPAEVFTIRGGHRVPAGHGAGQVRVQGVADGPTPESLILTVAPVGDYSTYTLELLINPAQIDPFFASIDFKFRPGCFTGPCAPDWNAGRERITPPVIDYMAKDYDSFRHQFIAAMMDRVPGWQASSEADLDQVLIGLFSAAADELSDYQDRVMAEASFGTARKRVSIARHARLMDYHIHQGQQSSTCLWLEIAEGTAEFELTDELITWAGGPEAEGGTVTFASRPVGAGADGVRLAPGFNGFHLHDWSGAHPALPRGATSADIVSAPTPTAPGGLITATALRDAISEGRLSRILIEERLNPLTGRAPGRNPAKRQVLRLITDPAPVVVHDPVAGVDVVRLHWHAEDALREDYSFTTICPDGTVSNISAFRGNLIEVHQGLPVDVHYHERGTELPVETPGVYHRHFTRPERYGEELGAICELPVGPLAYLPTPRGGEVPARSTLSVEVEEAGGAGNIWDERPDLVFSDDSSEEGDHFVVETDERQRSLLRFGNGVNGRRVPHDAVIHTRYQVGGGVIGNVGADAIRSFLPLPAGLAGAIVAVSNPFDVTDGAAPEPVDEILRFAPEAYRARQLRAVTLPDYIRRAEEVPGIARAVASYAWTGSWRTVRIVLDPEGATELDPDLLSEVSAHLEAVRLIGEDLELRPPRFVPLEIGISLCLTPDAWPEDVRYVIEQELSAGITPDGRRGFFHPDEWTFGQALDSSQIAGRLHRIAGIEHVIAITLRRWDAATGGVPNPRRIEAAFDEIFMVENDPDHLERGQLSIDLRGGRQ